MTTTVYERLKLGIELNDGVNRTVESLTFNPAQKRPMFVTNADADGESLVRESHFTSASFELKVRIEPQANVHTGLVKLGEITDAIQACEKVEGGQAMEWTPANTEDTYTVYVLSGDITGVPIEVEGDGAGWLLGAPVVTIKLICRPFLYSAERTVLAVTESAAEPLQVRYIKGIGGDVPAEARLIVTDKATQDRRFAMWGRDVVTSETNPAILLPASTALTGTGFSGESKTRTGAYGSEKVLRGTAVSQATTLCGTGRIENVGSYAVYLRVYSTSEASRFRISYRSGDGSLRPLEWKQAPVVNGWSELFMGMASLDAVTLGAQTGEIRVEQKATTGNPANDVNYLMLWPSKASGKARGIANNDATSLIAFDNFEQSAGNLEGKQPTYPTGITWAQVGKTGANGFQVAETDHTAHRTTVSDASLTAGCFALLGTTSYGAVSLSALLSASNMSISAEKARMALLARYVDASNWLILGVDTFVGGGAGQLYLSIVKSVAGVVTRVPYPAHATVPLGAGTSWGSVLVSATVGIDGLWTLSVLDKTASGTDTDLRSGGVLAAGKIGIYDAWTSAAANTRIFDSFTAAASEAAPRVCYSGKVVEFNPQGSLRQDSTGAYNGPPNSYRGAGFYLEPEGKLGLINRVAVRMRRNDVQVEEDSAVIDKNAIEVKARERALLPR